jgi:GntR family transcriptional regulator, transcriptional repressor for pyruvate dehydrogenase complex
MVGPKFQPIKQKKISTKIVEQIKSLILNGDLRPGEILPPERELMKSLNVSRPSLREALNSLRGMGFIETQRNRTVIKSLASGRMLEPLHHLLKEDIGTAYNLIEVRKAIETWSAYFAAERATDSDINRIEKCVSSMKTKIDEGISVVKEDADFHLAISEAAHNIIQTHLMFSIYDILKESLRKYYESMELLDTYGQHCKVVDAIKKRDAHLARRRMLEHLEYVESTLKDFSGSH